MSSDLDEIGSDFDQLKDSLRSFYAYWQKKCVSSRLPSKDDMDPVELRGLLNNIVLFEVLEGGQDFLVRICGQEVHDALGFSLKGERLSQLEQQKQVVPASEYFRRIITRRAPSCGPNRDLGAIGRPYVRYQSVVVPLASDGETVDYLMAAYTYGDS